jgi:hypothetical protein
MECVIVTYPRTRDVFIDGRRTGQTNQLLRVREGKQRFHLGTPVDYSPQSRTATVTGTSAAKPMLVEFALA